MKLLWIAPLLLAWPLVSAAEGNREYVGETMDGNAVYSYRTDRIERGPLGLSVWVYTDAKRPLYLKGDGRPARPYMSSVQSWVISCTARTFLPDQSTYFDKDGEVVSSLGSEGIPRKAIPDSLADMVITSVCARSGGN